jgi:glycerophosphoryl diester phosphodiesterase
MVHDLRSQSIIPQFVAHRGFSVRYPENTLLAIEQALLAGACYVECDVQLTLDGVPVLLHDDSLQRTCGVSANITELSWVELNNISAHYAERFGEQFGQISIPSLSQLLALMKNWPGRRVFVEIKRASIRKFGEDHVFNALIDALGRASEQVIVISFDLNIVQRISNETVLPVGWVIEEWTDANLALARQLAPAYLFVDHERIPHNLATLPDTNWCWALYEIDDAATAREWIEKGAHYIETNDIGSMLLVPEFAKSRCDG